jgi:hypothetical protein
MPRFRAMLRPFSAHPVWGAVAFSSLALIVAWALIPQVAQASLENVLIQVVGYIVGFFVSILGAILIKFIGILVTVAQFNNFIDAPAVKIGWSVTRDMANMFFIVALLLIAIGTMFRIDQYRYSRTLQKLIMMAILINFSKAIAGFFIDFSQVVMLTFVNAFKDQAAGSLSAGFGIDKLLTISSNVSAAAGDINTLSVLGSLFAALVMVFVATVVVAIFTILLIQRIIMLWIYIVLAPTAYMVAVLPGTLGSWWGTWWRDFSQYLIKGPVIAFFLWLALTVITLSTSALVVPSTSTLEPNLDNPTFVNEATTGSSIINYLVAVGMLIAGLQQAAKSSGAAGAVAGKWMGNFNKWGGAAAMAPVGLAAWTARKTGKAASWATERPRNAAANWGLNLVSNAPLIGNWAKKKKAERNQKQLAQEDKDTKHLRYMSDEDLTSSAGPNFFSQSGKHAFKGKIEELIRRKKQHLIDPEEMDKYKEIIGYKKTPKLDPVNGRVVGLNESAVDQEALKLLQDYHKERPDKLYEGYDGMSDTMKAATDAQADKFLKKLKPEGVEKLDDSVIDNPQFAGKLHSWFNQLGDGQKNEIRTRRVSQTMREFLDGQAPAGGGAEGGGEVLAHEDIDRAREARTAELRAKHGDAFEKSAEYMANPAQYYSSQQMAQNQRQQQRVMQRLGDKKAGVAEVTSLNNFSRGQSDMLAVSDTMLAQAGVKPTAGGYTRDKKSVARIAGVFNQQLTGDVQAIEAQLAQLATEEQGMQTPNSKLVDASGKPMTAAQANPEKLQDIQARRTALEARKATIQNAQKRLQDPKSLESLQFINTDRAGVDVRSVLAEERMHKNLDAVDPDRAIRNELRGTLSDEEFKGIADDMRQRTGDEQMSDQKAFDEYLTKGLVNRGRWGDKSANAVQLKGGLALTLKEKQEAAQKAGGKKVNLNVDDLDEVPDIVVPPKAGAGRYVAERTSEAWDTVKGKFTSGIEKRAAEERAAEQKVAAERQTQAVKQTEDKRKALEASQAAFATEEQKLQQIRQKNSPKAADMQKRYDELNKTYADRTKSRAERDKAYDLMGAYANDIDGMKKEVTEQEQKVATARQQRDTHQAELQSKVEAVPKPQPTSPAPKPTSASAGTTTKSSTSPSAEAGAAPTSTHPDTEPQDATRSNPEADTNVTNNVTNNITEVINSMSTPNRDNMLKLTGKNLDEAFVNSVHMLGLKGMLESTLKEIQSSKKLSEISNTELVKRFTAAQKHTDEGTPEAKESLKEEIKKIQSLLGGNS